jgi:hypothetical protein
MSSVFSYMKLERSIHGLLKQVTRNDEERIENWKLGMRINAGPNPAAPGGA